MPMLRRLLAALDQVGGVLALSHLLQQLLLAQVVGVAGAGVDGEASLGESGEGAHEVGGHAGDQPGAEQHGVHVPVGVVVGEHRPAHVLLVVRGGEVAGGGEDRVHRVVGVLAPVAVGVGAVHPPGGGHELHPPHGAGARHVEVAAVVGLDLVDRGQHLPAHAVLDAGGLVDRQQERRHPELADDEVGHPGGGRRAGEGVHEAGVRAGGGAVGVAQLGLVRVLAAALLLHVALERLDLLGTARHGLSAAGALLGGAAGGDRGLLLASRPAWWRRARASVRRPAPRRAAGPARGRARSRAPGPARVQPEGQRWPWAPALGWRGSGGRRRNRRERRPAPPPCPERSCRRSSCPGAPARSRSRPSRAAPGRPASEPPPASSWR